MARDYTPPAFPASHTRAVRRLHAVVAELKGVTRDDRAPVLPQGGLRDAGRVFWPPPPEVPTSLDLRRPPPPAPAPAPPRAGPTLRQVLDASGVAPGDNDSAIQLLATHELVVGAAVEASAADVATTGAAGAGTGAPSRSGAAAPSAPAAVGLKRASESPPPPGAPAARSAATGGAPPKKKARRAKAPTKEEATQRRVALAARLPALLAGVWEKEWPGYGNPFRLVITRENCAHVGAPDYFEYVTDAMNLTWIQEARGARTLPPPPSPISLSAELRPRAETPRLRRSAYR